MSAAISMPRSNASTNAKVETILRLQVPMIVQIGARRMSFDEVLALGPGAILELDKDADEPLALLVNNKRVGIGVAVKVGENFGIKIQQIDSPRQRVAAVAGQSDSDPQPAAASTTPPPPQTPASDDAQAPDDASA